MAFHHSLKRGIGIQISTNHNLFLEPWNTKSWLVLILAILWHSEKSKYIFDNQSVQKLRLAFNKLMSLEIVMEYLWKVREKLFKDPSPSISFVNKYCFALWDCIFIDVSTTSYQTLLVARLHGEQGAVFPKTMKSAWISPLSFNWNCCHLHTSHYLRFTIDSEALKTGIFPHSPWHEPQIRLFPMKNGQ